MAVSIEKHRDKTYIIILMALIIFLNIAILVIPFTFSVFDKSGVTWNRTIWFYGAWFEFDRIEETQDFGGIWTDLPGYSVAIGIIILVAIVFTTVAIFFTGKNKWRNPTIQRIGAIFVETGAILGFIGTMLFWRFGQIQTFDLTMQYYIGFYVAVIYFPLIMVLNFRSIIVSNQLPKPKETPPPSQEGILMDEGKKIRKKRQLFKHIDDIQEAVDNREV
ncbi:MAG: hypothetical protein ACFFDW_03785 [Candidatus Thorarchaeota archaeon]